VRGKEAIAIDMKGSGQQRDERKPLENLMTWWHVNSRRKGWRYWRQWCRLWWGQ